MSCGPSAGAAKAPVTSATIARRERILWRRTSAHSAWADCVRPGKSTKSCHRSQILILIDDTLPVHRAGNKRYHHLFRDGCVTREGGGFKLEADIHKPDETWEALQFRPERPSLLFGNYKLLCLVGQQESPSVRYAQDAFGCLLNARAFTRL
jgi:hypothetical protein